MTYFHDKKSPHTLGGNIIYHMNQHKFPWLDIELVKEGKDKLPLVVFTKDVMYTDKPIPVVNILPLSSVVGTTNQVIMVNIYI